MRNPDNVLDFALRSARAFELDHRQPQLHPLPLRPRIGVRGRLDALVAEYDYAGTMMIKRYAHWVGQPAPAEAGVPLVSYEGASLENAAGRWLIADHQGSIIAGAHPTGATAWVNTYDEYGIPGAGNSGRFQYTGQIWLAELGMYHYKAQVYSPTLGWRPLLRSFIPSAAASSNP